MEKAREEGMTAATYSWGLASCPYAWGTDEFTAWLEGYREQYAKG